jgi:hypothetical protein
MHGPIDRQSDIARTAEALLSIQEKRAFFLRVHARNETPFKWQVLACAWASPLTDRNVRQLLGHVLTSKRDGTGAKLGHQMIADLSGTSVRSSERSDAELKAGGWLSVLRRKQSSSIRDVRIPSPVLDILRSFDPPPMAGQDTSRTATHGGANQDYGDNVSRTATHDGSRFLNRHPCRQEPPPMADRTFGIEPEEKKKASQKRSAENEQQLRARRYLEECQARGRALGQQKKSQHESRRR